MCKLHFHVHFTLLEIHLHHVIVNSWLFFGDNLSGSVIVYQSGLSCHSISRHAAMVWTNALVPPSLLFFLPPPVQAVGAQHKHFVLPTVQKQCG